MKDNIIVLENKCCGCLACKNVCPNDAITTEFRNGFCYPFVHDDKCIHCGLCIDVCPIFNTTELLKHENNSNTYIGFNKNSSINRHSTSGGIFPELSMAVYTQGGYIYGAIFDNELKVIHVRADDIADAKKFSKSKYVQSDISGIYSMISDDLNRGKKVLFSGTPCQCASIKKFLNSRKINQYNLYLVDILCYGVPSPKVFLDHLGYIEKKFASVVEYDFRDERNGRTQNYIHSALLSDGTELYDNDLLQAFHRLYGNRLNMRESCFSCPFATVKRCTDITIGDCWGTKKIEMDFKSQNGVSQIHINTSKGNYLWNLCKDHIDFIEVDVNKLLPFNSQLSHPALKPDEYDDFWKDYNKKGYGFVLQKYSAFGLLSYYWRLKKRLKLNYRKVIK